jgi:single-stranded DNA-specific DHH superfamily exonuclease
MEKLIKGVQSAYNIDKYNPFRIKGINESLDRIIRAINGSEKIIIYGNPDLDGIIGTSLLVLALKYFRADVEYYISDGNDLCDDKIFCNIIEHFKYLGANLVISSISEVCNKNRIKLFLDSEIDLIITNNHKITELIDHSYLINPNLEDCSYSYKNLATSSVIFKFVQAICIFYRSRLIDDYFDLVMLAILSKETSLKDENKFIVKQGMIRIANTENQGIRALIKVNNITLINKKNITSMVKKLSKQINIHGSIDNARIAVELFTTLDGDRAEQISKYLDKQSE